MALSVKVAFLSCFGFISGMCWLVNQVARPMIELPSPLDSPAMAVTVPPRGPVAAANPHGAFEREAPVVVAAAETPYDSDLLHVDALPDAPAHARRVKLPPLQAAPVVVAAAEAPETVPAEPRHALAAAPARSQSDEPLVPVVEIVAASLSGDRGGDDEARTAPTGREYAVRRGDSLALIARREIGSDDPRMVDVLVAMNPQLATRRNRILVGETLRVPTAEAARELLAAGPAQAVAEAAVASASGRTSRPNDGKIEPRWYTVRANDSLEHIARRELNDPSRWREIAELNGLKDANRIPRGARLRLPADGQS